MFPTVTFVAGVAEEPAAFCALASSAVTSPTSTWSMTKRLSAQALVPVAARPRTAAPPRRNRRRGCLRDFEERSRRPESWSWPDWGGSGRLRVSELCMTQPCRPRVCQA